MYRKREPQSGMEEEKIDKIFTTIKSCFSFHINHLQLGEKNRTIAVGGKVYCDAVSLSLHYIRFTIDVAWFAWQRKRRKCHKTLISHVILTRALGGGGRSPTTNTRKGRDWKIKIIFMGRTLHWTPESMQHMVINKTSTGIYKNTEFP